MHLKFDETSNQTVAFILYQSGELQSFYIEQDFNEYDEGFSQY